MPNHCYHNISIGSEITKERQEILDAIEKVGCICRYYKPMPSELEGTTSPQRVGDTENCTITESKSAELKHKYGHDNWYDWCYDNWGTKWGCYEFEKDDDQLRFTTAWSPMDELIIKQMAQDFPDMFWTFEEEQGWGAEFDIEGGDFINVKTYDVPTWNGEEEIDCGERLPTTLTKLADHHPNFDDGIGWYVDWSHEFAGKTLKEAKEYVLKNCYL